MCPIFRARTELQWEKLEKPVPVSAENTRPVYLILYSSYLMPELCFQVLHGAGCLEHYLQQSTSTSVLGPRLQKGAHEGSTGSSRHLHSPTIPSEHRRTQRPAYLIGAKRRAGLAK